MIYHQNSQKFHILPGGLDIDHIILCSAYFPTDHSPGIDFGDSKWDNFVAKVISVKETGLVQSLSRVGLFVTPWIAAHQASLSITNSWSSLRLNVHQFLMPSSHLILCHSLLLLPPIPPSIRVFANESTLHMRWPKYWSFSFSIISSKEIPGLISFRMDLLDLLKQVRVILLFIKKK